MCARGKRAAVIGEHDLFYLVLGRIDKECVLNLSCS